MNIVQAGEFVAERTAAALGMDVEELHHAPMQDGPGDDHMVRCLLAGLPVDARLTIGGLNTAANNATAVLLAAGAAVGDEDVSTVVRSMRTVLAQLLVMGFKMGEGAGEAKERRVWTAPPRDAYKPPHGGRSE